MEREKSRKADEESQNAWSLQALADNETFTRFCQTVDGVLEQGDSLDTELKMPKNKKRRSGGDHHHKGDENSDESDEEEEMDEIDPDLRIELYILEELRRGSARLRENHALQVCSLENSIFSAKNSKNCSLAASKSVECDLSTDFMC